MWMSFLRGLRALLKNNMITTIEFRKQVSNTLSIRMKELGFKGSSFNYRLDSEHFVFAFGIQANRYGGSFCAEFGIYPKQVVIQSQKMDFNKIRYFDCKVRTRITPRGMVDFWWQYSEMENENIKSVLEVTDLISDKYLYIVNKLLEDPEIFKNEDNIFNEDGEVILQEKPIPKPNLLNKIKSFLKKFESNYSKK